MVGTLRRYATPELDRLLEVHEIPGAGERPAVKVYVGRVLAASILVHVIDADQKNGSACAMCTHEPGQFPEWPHSLAQAARPSPV